MKFFQVLLRESIYISDGLHQRLMASKTDSCFVGEAAVVIFLAAGLAGHSVTGTQCNRTKIGAKPALNKVKYSVLSGMRVQSTIHNICWLPCFNCSGTSALVNRVCTHLNLSLSLHPICSLC